MHTSKGTSFVTLENALTEYGAEYEKIPYILCNIMLLQVMPNR